MWNFAEIDPAEGDDQQNFFINPTKEIQILSESGIPANILTVQRGEKHWVVGDANGFFWKLDLPDFSQSEILRSNSGKIFDLAISST